MTSGQWSCRDSLNWINLINMVQRLCLTVLQKLCQLLDTSVNIVLVSHVVVCTQERVLSLFFTSAMTLRDPWFLQCWTLADVPNASTNTAFNIWGIHHFHSPPKRFWQHLLISDPLSDTLPKTTSLLYPNSSKTATTQSLTRADKRDLSSLFHSRSREGQKGLYEVQK